MLASYKAFLSLEIFPNVNGYVEQFQVSVHTTSIFLTTHATTKIAKILFVLLHTWMNASSFAG